MNNREANQRVVPNLNQLIQNASNRQLEIQEGLGNLRKHVGQASDALEIKVNDLLGRCVEICDEFGLTVADVKGNAFWKQFRKAKKNSGSSKNDIGFLYEKLEMVVKQYTGALSKEQKNLNAVRDAGGPAEIN